jgi:hypothetical protein
MAKCFVSYVDMDGIRHEVEVDAESLYEAAALAIQVFRVHDYEPRGLAELEVEIRSSIVHTIKVNQVHEWLKRRGKTPKEVVTKDRLRTLL